LTDEDAFEEYLTFFQKSYDAVEKQMRLDIFKEAGKKIAELNKNSQFATFGYTKFADWDDWEFQQLLGFRATEEDPLPEVNVINDYSKRSVFQGQAIDWVAKGMTTPIKNQGQCGSCWAFSATETIESANLIAGRQVPHGSEQEIVDCDTNDSGCDGGDPREAIRWVQSQGGQETNNCYPYTAQDGNCMQSSCQPSSALQVSSVVPIPGDESSMYQSLQSYPLSICCDASQWQYYNGGVLTADQCGTSIDHAIQLTGFSPNQGGYWIVRNSWGADWGEQGFIYLSYGQNTCGITSRVTGATA